MKFEIFRGRALIAFLAALMFSTVLVPAQLAAQSQNEILTTVLFDGTQFDVDPLDNGTGDGVHTPGWTVGRTTTS